MATFTEFYTTLLGFVNFRLYQTLNLVYPPKVSHTEHVNVLALNALILCSCRIPDRSNCELNLFVFFGCVLAWWTRRDQSQIRVWRRLCPGLRKLYWGTRLNSFSLFITTIYFVPNVTVCLKTCPLQISLQKLSALSASLARMVPTVEEEETQLDHFPTEGVSEWQLSLLLGMSWWGHFPTG